MTTELTSANVRELFDYDPSTGVLTRKPCHQNKWQPAPIRAKNSDGYLVAKAGQRVHKAHRLIWLWMYGEWPQGEIDHINRVRDDNRIDNLRVVPRGGNCENKAHDWERGFSTQKDHRRTKPYRARIRVKGREIHLGYFDTPEDASAAYVEAKRKFHVGGEVRS